jgi:GNAT superfamily N-acetyltransferase
MLIRAMAEADREAVIGLLGELNAFEFTLSDDRSLDPADWSALLQAHETAVGSKGGQLLVAEESGAVIGFCALLFEHDEPLYVRADVRPHGRITELVVTKTARAAGVGRALLRQAEACCRQAGLAAMAIGALAGNEVALGLYQSEGFQVQATELLKRL